MRFRWLWSPEGISSQKDDGWACTASWPTHREASIPFGPPIWPENGGEWGYLFDLFPKVEDKRSFNKEKNLGKGRALWIALDIKVSHMAEGQVQRLHLLHVPCLTALTPASHPNPSLYRASQIPNAFHLVATLAGPWAKPGCLDPGGPVSGSHVSRVIYSVINQGQQRTDPKTQPLTSFLF